MEPVAPRALPEARAASRFPSPSVVTCTPSHCDLSQLRCLRPQVKKGRKDAKREQKKATQERAAEARAGGLHETDVQLEVWEEPVPKKGNCKATGRKGKGKGKGKGKAKGGWKRAPRAKKRAASGDGNRETPKVAKRDKSQLTQIRKGGVPATDFTTSFTQEHIRDSQGVPLPSLATRLRNNVSKCTAPESWST
jgi:hypothetical protein